MNPTIYATFEDLAAAKQAQEALVEQGIPTADVTLACKAHHSAGSDMNERQEFGGMARAFPDLRAVGPGDAQGNVSMGTIGATFTGLAASANAAINPGEMTDYLWSRMPADMAAHYKKEYDGGKAILVIRAPYAQSEPILRSLGATLIERQGYLA